MTPIHVSRCDQLGVCQLHRTCGSHKACADQAAPLSDEAADVPPTSVDACLRVCRLLAIAFVVLAAFVLGTSAGSALLHTFDAEIREALTSAWAHLSRLYWTALNQQG